MLLDMTIHDLDMARFLVGTDVAPVEVYCTARCMVDPAIGEAGDAFADALAPHCPVSRCGTLDIAVHTAALAAKPGDTVLLSPACASFDQFRDFEDRGDRFRALVHALADSEATS